ncbi:MAG TPA: cytochrome c oxidase assembly factor Coa1 family protein [Rhizomicrobium sp.]|jgi:hypothetical protein
MPDEPQRQGLNRGLLWGCFTPVAIVILLIAAWFAYNTYYYTSGYKQAAGLPAVMRVVRTSPLAAQMLGSNIHIRNMELQMPSNAKQNGHRIFYKVRVSGDKGAGEVQTSVLIAPDGSTKITNLRLIDDNEVPHDLLGASPAP